MEATQDTLFPMPAASRSEHPDWRDNARRLAKIGHDSGGLVPQSVLHKILGVSRARGHQLCQDGKVQVINFCGVPFVTGDSIEEYRRAEVPHGRGHKLNRWDRIALSVPFGQAIADALVPD